MSDTVEKYIALIKPGTASDSIYHNPANAEIYLGVYEGQDALEKAAIDARTAPENIRLISFQNLDDETVRNSGPNARTLLSIESTDGNVMVLSAEELAARLGISSINQVTLTVENEDNISISAIVSTLEKDYPAINIEGRDSDHHRLYLSNVELPNKEYPAAITTRLMAGYEIYETDMPIAMVPTHLLSPKELEQRENDNAQADVSTIPQKILYVDMDLAWTRDWTSATETKSLQEHEPEYQTGGV